MSLFGWSDDDIFSVLNGVMVGWGLLFFAPRWKYTPTAVLSLCIFYSFLYMTLAMNSLLLSDTKIENVDFSSLDGVANMFRHRPVVLVGWTHYIAFDLFVARYVVIDSQEQGMPHWPVAILCLPLTLLAGPCGFVVYFILRNVWKGFLNLSNSQRTR